MPSVPVPPPEDEFLLDAAEVTSRIRRGLLLPLLIFGGIFSSGPLLTLVGDLSSENTRSLSLFEWGFLAATLLWGGFWWWLRKLRRRFFFFCAIFLLVLNLLIGGALLNAFLWGAGGWLPDPVAWWTKIVLLLLAAMAFLGSCVLGMESWTVWRAFRGFTDKQLHAALEEARERRKRQQEKAPEE